MGACKRGVLITLNKSWPWTTNDLWSQKSFSILQILVWTRLVYQKLSFRVCKHATQVCYKYHLSISLIPYSDISGTPQTRKAYCTQTLLLSAAMPTCPVSNRECMHWTAHVFLFWLAQCQTHLFDQQSDRITTLCSSRIRCSCIYTPKVSEILVYRWLLLVD